MTCQLKKTLLVLTLCCSAVAAFSPVGLPSKLSDNMALMAVRRSFNRRGPPVIDKGPPMNDQLPPGDVRVTTPSAKGKDLILGIMSRDDALAKAKEMGGLDLILVNPNSDPPVCKIVDYSKYRYMQEKKAKEIKKNSKTSELKEVKMSYKIDVHDYEVRKKNALKFLNQGNRVKCTIAFRGREQQHTDLGFDLLEKMATDMDDICVKEGKPKREGRFLFLIVSPKPEVLKKLNENRRAEDKAKKNKKEKEKVEYAATKAEKAAAAAEALNVANGEASAALAASREEGFDLESDIESSLDDLFGSDDLTDDLFS
jgi:translation initiation factor IF-3